jgi:hypothetical protein
MARLMFLGKVANDPRLSIAVIARRTYRRTDDK